MSIPLSGTFTRSAGLVSAIAKQLKQVNLKPVKKIVVKFDPFYENVLHTREFLFHITGRKILLTNANCMVKTEIICDRSEPTVTLNLSNGETVLMKCGNLTALEMLQLYNKHVTPLAPVEDKSSKQVKTKSEKASTGMKIRRR